MQHLCSHQGSATLELVRHFGVKGCSMSYDLYCYRLASGTLVEAINAAEEGGEKTPTPSHKEKITTALVEHNPGTFGSSEGQRDFSHTTQRAAQRSIPRKPNCKTTHRMKRS